MLYRIKDLQGWLKWRSETFYAEADEIFEHIMENSLFEIRERDVFNTDVVHLMNVSYEHSNAFSKIEFLESVVESTKNAVKNILETP